MKYFLNAFVFSSLCLPVLSQEKSVDFESLPHKTIIFAASPPKEMSKIKFNGVYVLDARFDTSLVGYWKSTVDSKFSVLKLDDGAEKVNLLINNYYRNSFDSVGYAVLLVIKKLWISQVDTMIIKNAKLPSTRSERLTLLSLKFEWYVRNGSDFYPMVRTDSSYFIHKPDLFTNNSGEGLSKAISHAADRALFTDPDKIKLTRKKLSIEQIRASIDALNNVPILVEKQYKKGVYVTFDDFLKNNPSLIYTEIDQKKYGDVLFVVGTDGKEYATNHVWGYCDGKDLFISAGRNFFKLVRAGNTFMFKGTRGVDRLLTSFSYTSEKLGTLSMRYNEMAMRYYIYQIDMEKGTFY